MVNFLVPFLICIILIIATIHFVCVCVCMCVCLSVSVYLCVCLSVCVRPLCVCVCVCVCAHSVARMSISGRKHSEIRVNFIMYSQRPDTHHNGTVRQVADWLFL